MAKKAPDTRALPSPDFNGIMGKGTPSPEPSREPPNVQQFRRDVKRLQKATYRPKEKK